MLAKPSPRKPMLATCSKSFKVLILLVAWRWSASSMSSGWMPPPLSLTRMRRMPPPASSTSIARRACVYAVFDDFFEGVGGAFDHFAGGDLVDKMVGAGRQFGTSVSFKKATAEEKITGICASIRIRRGRFLFSCNTAVPSDS